MGITAWHELGQETIDGSLAAVHLNCKQVRACRCFPSRTRTHPNNATEWHLPRHEIQRC